MYIRDGRAPIPKNKNISRVMSANRAKNTGPEIILRRALRKTGLDNFRLHPKKIIGRPDIVFSEKKVAIFLHGCFWHRCPRCKMPLPKTNRNFWKNKFLRNKARDIKKIKELKSANWRIIVIWEHEIKKDPYRVTKMIYNFIQKS